MNKSEKFDAVNLCYRLIYFSAAAGLYYYQWNLVPSNSVAIEQPLKYMLK